jgi:uncharacterized protein with PhoU and TrkA domain
MPAFSETETRAGVEYEPRPVKDLLIEMKDIAELSVDLAYSALIFDSEEIAEEVLRLESRMYRLRYLLRLQVMLSTRTLQDAQMMLGILQVAGAGGTIANAAADIVKVLSSELEYRPLAPFILKGSGERIRLITMEEASPLTGQTLADLSLETRLGIRVIAVRRGKRWTYDVHDDVVFKAGDQVIVVGTEEGIDHLRAVAAGKSSYEDAVKAQPAPAPAPTPPQTPGTKGETDAWFVELKDTSDLMVDLAYSAILYDSREIAEEVEILEEEVDELVGKLQRRVIEEAIETKNVDKPLIMFHLSTAIEQIADAAREIADAALRDIQVHPVLVESVRESDVTVTRTAVGPDSVFAAKTLRQLQLATKTGMRVIAIRRAKKWIVGPGPEDKVEAGDVLFARGPPAAEDHLRALCTGKRRRI